MGYVLRAGDNSEVICSRTYQSPQFIRKSHEKDICRFNVQIELSSSSSGEVPARGTTEQDENEGEDTVFENEWRCLCKSVFPFSKWPSRR